MNWLAKLVTMSFPYATETVCLAMAIQGSMAVRHGPNKARTMHWFHALVRSTLTAYAGATFTNIFMGRPTAMLANDIFFGACLLGFAVVNYTPFNVGHALCDSPPGRLAVTVLSQVFRVGGIKGFSDAAFEAFRESPSPYYDVPVFGPVLFPSVLGNMGGFFFGGLDGYLEKGMPWLFQQVSREFKRAKLACWSKASLSSFSILLLWSNSAHWISHTQFSIHYTGHQLLRLLPLLRPRYHRRHRHHTPHRTSTHRRAIHVRHGSFRRRSLERCIVCARCRGIVHGIDGRAEDANAFGWKI